MRRPQPARSGGLQGCARLSAILLALLTGGCATAWVDEEGRCHILGLAHVVLARPPPDAPIAGATVRIDTLGLAALDVGQGRQWLLGYGRLAFATLKDDALVLGPVLLDGRRDAPAGPSVPAEAGHPQTREKTDDGPPLQPAHCPPPRERPED
ncbi:MAG: hypothetical protein KatS3mg119_0639 [Rhodothalassiaceae bacterium]|nr:MAG: hypothetical protein KatS3mg119_0639 [Rhodothalassiaceae bacterium]